jgi:hypothetical protein
MREPPWEVVFTLGLLAAGFANGIPAFDNPTLVGRRRIAPVRLLSFSELAFGDLNQLVLAAHGQMVRTLHGDRRTAVQHTCSSCRALAS